MPPFTVHTPACLILAGLSLTLPLYAPLTLFGAAYIAAVCLLLGLFSGPFAATGSVLLAGALLWVVAKMLPKQ